ncbi:hypothetical protein [Marinobacter sp. F3R11]|uniref:hypothetical protein n=1 Tax=Marinobacter sp. F3R11 TaxID=2267231 RepID=UPI000DEA75A7|nr:hypothetical protein [Marinobacter sp. F3R11]RBW48703.1 hypothetical protein DS878_11100 [Marinobacter sp. F3R11]
MPRLVITSCFRVLSVLLVGISAAAMGSARPMELPDRHVQPPETPELVILSEAGGGLHVHTHHG